MNRFPIENIDKVNSSKLTDKLSTSRTISLTGDISSSIQFDGSSNVSTEVEIADNSHNHTLENITNLQSNLDTINDNISTINDTLSKKANSTHTHEISNINNLQNSLDSKGIKLSIDGTTLKLLDSNNSELSSVTTQDTDTIYTLTKSDIINKLGYTPVKSVNGTTADTAGNVALGTLTTAIVSQKLDTTFSLAEPNGAPTSTAKTVTGLTAYKPVMIFLHGTSGAGFSIRITSGVAVTSVYLDGAMYNANSGWKYPNANWITVVPTATSMTIQFTTNNGCSGRAIVYQ